MSRMITGNFTQTMTPGLGKVYQDTIRDIPKEFRQWANILTGPSPEGEAGSNFLDELQVSSLGTFAAKPEGDSIQFDDIIEGNTVRATPYAFALGYRCTHEAKADGRYGVFEKLTGELAQAAMHQMEVQAHRILNNGFGTTGGTGHTATGFDSLALFSTAHTRIKDGGTRANRLTTDLDLSITALETMQDLMEGWVNHSGMPTPKRVNTLIIPYQLKWIARELTESELKPFTGNNEVNPIGGEFQFMVSHYLDDSDSYYILAPKSQHNLKVWIRETPAFEMGDDFDTGDTKAKGFFRMASWHGEPDGAVGSQGA